MAGLVPEIIAERDVAHEAVQIRAGRVAPVLVPEGAPGRNALDVHMLRLRRRLSPLRLSIRTVRSRGYLLEASGFSQQKVADA